MTGVQYWQKRQEQKYLAGEKKIDDYYRGLKKSFEQSKKEVQSVINDFYWRYAQENGVTFVAAQIQLSKAEIGELQDFIDRVNASMGKYDQQLNNMSIKARITRYQALEKQIDAVLQQLYTIDYEAAGKEKLKDVYSDSYYRTWFNIDQYHGFHQEFAQIGAKTVEELITYPFDGANFSARLWKQKDHLLQQLTESVTTMMIQGRNPRTLAGDFAKKFERKEFEAYRLLNTEGSFIMEQASQAAYKEDDVEKYQWLATLDVDTCDECQALDGQTFDVDKGIVGVNLPPLHPFDRCTTVPYYDDQDISDDTRVARDPVTGKGYEVPADMKYPEWHKQYIEDNPEAALAEKKIKNYDADKKQYEEYGEKLGREYLPKSLDDFQNMKYTDPTEYGILKAQSRGMTYYNKAVAAEPEITAQVKKVAESTGMDTAGLEYRIKGKDSYLRKIKSKYDPNGNEYEVKDILRYTYTSSPMEMTQKTLNAIDNHKELGYNTIEVKNYWMIDTDPYNGINTTLRAPSGQKFELQYHTTESFNLKNGKLHDLYEKQRVISDRSNEEYLRLDDEMYELSEKLTIPPGIERIKSHGQN